MKTLLSVVVTLCLASAVDASSLRCPLPPSMTLGGDATGAKDRPLVAPHTRVTSPERRTGRPPISSLRTGQVDSAAGTPAPEAADCPDGQCPAPGQPSLWRPFGGRFRVR